VGGSIAFVGIVVLAVILLLRWRKQKIVSSLGENPPTSSDIPISIIPEGRNAESSTASSEETAPILPPLPEKFEDYFGLSGVSMKKWNLENGKSHRELLSPTSRRYGLALDLFRYVDGDGLIDAITAVHGVINPNVASNFRSHRKLLEKRLENDPTLFRKDNWKAGKSGDLREWVMLQFGEIAKRFSWNSVEDHVPVIPVVHGTDASVAWKILDTGFSALSSLDAGYYGRGIYFTSSTQYALPYYASKSNPALLLCLAIPGNVYPAVEGPKDANSLLGTPVKSGYQSHYVLTNKDGMPCPQRQEPGTFYDELVLDQESQVVPVAIIEFSHAKLAPIARAFQREIVEPKAEADSTMPVTREARLTL